MRQHMLGLVCLVAGTLIGLPPDASAADCEPTSFDGAFAGEVTLCQNWDYQQQQEFWFLSQGSLIIPYDWFLALEQPGSSTLFRDAAHMDGFRYLPQKSTLANPDGLPIGFTRDSARGNEFYEDFADDWLGLTCAACHSGQIELNGAKILIDGAPAMADFEGFIWSLVNAMKATLVDLSKFDRFAKQVLGGRAKSRLERLQLLTDLRQLTGVRQAWNEDNRGAHRYGFARLDAIGAIFNKVAATATGQAQNNRLADAPVSYPFIWDTPQHDRVQWNGSVANKGLGALGRNVGEVLGVFGALELNTRRLGLSGHDSSVDLRHLGRLEALLWELQSPLWPENLLTDIDRSEATQSLGRETYEKMCRSCHADITRDDPERRITAVLTPLGKLGTDSKMADNFADRRYASGPLERRFKRYLPITSRFKRFEEEGAGVEFLGYGVIGTIVRGLILDPVGTIRAAKAGRPPEERRLLERLEERLGERPSLFEVIEALENVARREGRDEEPPAVGKAYKARPLNGIWATAPYLHNGSVRTMRQLLMPASERQTSFRVGSREYDPEDMGFVDAGGYLFDTSLPGNSKDGHEYGARKLQAEPKRLEALLEYLKTL